MKRILITVFTVFALTIVISAQQRRMGGPPGNADTTTGQPGQRPDPTAALKATLGLTDAQVDSIKALLQTRQTRGAAIMTEIQTKRTALDTLLDATTPNATAVGNAAIDLRASEKKLQAERDWFLTELKKLLTGAQQQTLDSLIAAGTPIPGLFGGPGFGGPRGGRGPRP